MPVQTYSGLDADKARAIGRASTDFLLRTLRVGSAEHEGSVVRAIIFLSIISANTAHLSRARDGEARYEALDDAPPEEALRPVSVLAIANSLGIPFETTRRHVSLLIESGHCTRAIGGVIASTQMISAEHTASLILGNLANVRQFLSELRNIGVSV